MARGLGASGSRLRHVAARRLHGPGRVRSATASWRRVFHEAGGAYVYLREAWGERVAFLYGWKCLLVMDPGTHRRPRRRASREYVAYLVAAWARADARPIAVVILLDGRGPVTALGTRLAAGSLVAMTALKGAHPRGDRRSGASPRGSAMAWERVRAVVHAATKAPRPCVAALAGGFVAAFFSFGGWWEMARMAGEVRNPSRNLPLAFVGGSHDRDRGLHPDERGLSRPRRRRRRGGLGRRVRGPGRRASVRGGRRHGDGPARFSFPGWAAWPP